MNSFFCSLESLLIFFVGFSSCIIEDTVLSDSWDDCEAFHAVFSSSDELSNEYDIPENITMTREPDQSNESTSALEIEVLGETYLSPSLIDDSNQIESTSQMPTEESSQRESTSETPMTVPEKRVIGHAVKYKNTPTKIFVTIGVRSRGDGRNTIIFNNLNPGISIIHQLSREQLESTIFSLGAKYQWKELSDYPIRAYYGYWAHVCDYFWVKTRPNDEQYRGCYVNTHLLPYSRAKIVYTREEGYIKAAKIDLLKCQCYYYGHHSRQPTSAINDFSVLKHHNGEYFMLEKFPGKKCFYTISDVLTRVHLPEPQSFKESNHLDDTAPEDIVTSPTSKPVRRNVPYRKILTIGDRSRVTRKQQAIFNNLKPGKSNRHILSEEQLELEFVSHKDPPRWIELKEYPLVSHLGYWGNVCDYFWEKPTEDDSRFRCCYVRMTYYPYTLARVILTHISDTIASQKLDVLQCQCYYYVKHQTKPDSNKSIFAVYKHRDNEYFILNKIPDVKRQYTIFDFMTGVYLPDPTI